MPYDDLTGIVKGSIVESTGDTLKVPVGEGLIGRVIDGFGNPIDGKGELDIAETYYPVQGEPVKPAHKAQDQRAHLDGEKAIDSLLTCGKGQRMGIFRGKRRG
jgi:flagellum-specific ATP synthase